MIDGFPRLVNQLIESRLEDIITSEEYEMFMEGIYKDLEQKLSSSIKDLDEEAKNNLIEDLKSNIFQQVFQKSKLTYRVAFKDALSFFVDTLLIPKR
ncbi:MULTISPECIES: hypothetical protein [Bacillaceae]|uniref:Uncharacterized protein n=1 Tax=Oceanobacillus caeni TaxID=405946 RepID=A0ABR5MF64_9BACI|nr:MULTISPECIES: hypothetical protein [Bacillaceae]KPH69315.1 hypothetical protein AFL42_17220 [Oceanobacillus caeni]MBU8791372.1 hypothetical protein [Oceanobacillus caeni]MED4475974.1 hypothetical protein [Oceanobacillus caeni]